MKKIFIVASLAIGSLAFSQATGKVGVNEAAPQATLDIKPNATNLAGTTNEGVLVPRLTKARVAAIPAASRVESTLVYVTDDVLAADNATFTGTGKGFYYYDAATSRWVKMGAGAGATSGANLAPATGSIRVLANITAAQWTPTDFTIVLTNGLTAADLPPAASNAGRIISIRNASAGLITYTANAPLNNSTISLNRGQLIQSDGINWYVIAGF